MLQLIADGKTVGQTSIAWYGVIFSIALVVALSFGIHNAKKIKLTGDDILTLFLYTVPLAVIFARLLYVITHTKDYNDFVSIFKIWEGGVTIYGGVLGGILGVFIFSRVKKISFLTITDFAVSPLLVGQSIGRWGNFVNQEAFGKPILNDKLHHFPFAVKITNPQGVDEALWKEWSKDGKNQFFAATFFYEICLNLIGLALIFNLWKRYKRYKGVWTVLYLLWFMIVRGALDYIRIDGTEKLQNFNKYAGAPVILIMLFLMLFLVYAQKSREVLFKVQSAIKRNTLSTVYLTKEEVWLYMIGQKIVSKRISNQILRNKDSQLNIKKRWNFYEGIENNYFKDLKKEKYLHGKEKLVFTVEGNV